ncbi:hypothetical protein VE00_02782 [Pseudogymnoascus sp. WSF 3629]|nr:hypothetical protein VE00_02782 [Pseudogymnoascus sp. WSF 3629]
MKISSIIPLFAALAAVKAQIAPGSYIIRSLASDELGYVGRSLNEDTSQNPKPILLLDNGNIDGKINQEWFITPVSGYGPNNYVVETAHRARRWVAPNPDSQDKQLGLKPLIVARSLPPFYPPIEGVYATIDERASEGIWLAVIGQTGLIAAAICTAGIPTGAPGIAACVVSCIVAGIASIFALLIKPEVPTPPVRMARHEDIGYHFSIHPDYIGDSGCNTGCKLAATSPQGKWAHFANSTKDDLTHNLHYYQSGKYRGIRAALVSPASTTKRQVEVGIEFEKGADPNWVASIYWEDDVEVA